MRVNLEDLEKWRALVAEINAAELENIEWCRGGEVQPIDEVVYKNYDWVGLSNAFFPVFAGLIDEETWQPSQNPPAKPDLAGEKTE